jgi:hypothetical protein
MTWSLRKRRCCGASEADLPLSIKRVLTSHQLTANALSAIDNLVGAVVLLKQVADRLDVGAITFERERDECSIANGGPGFLDYVGNDAREVRAAADAAKAVMRATADLLDTQVFDAVCVTQSDDFIHSVYPT